MNGFCKLGSDAGIFAVGIAFILFSCSGPDGRTEIIWENNCAVSVNFSKSWVTNVAHDSLSSKIQISLGDFPASPILGEFIVKEQKISFIPVVPFTRGMHYHIIAQGKIIAEFTIPIDSLSKKPELSIYPSQDTLPENILKMYFMFSEPMVEGQSLQHIYLLSNGDTVSGTFLDLQPELWSSEGTMLTLWFDPGRVKRDLIPNQLMGNPLVIGQHYTLHISGKWKSKAGIPLKQSYIKSFSVSERDEEIPNPDNWLLTVPQVSTAPLSINFTEPLDYSLAQSTIHLLDENGTPVSGKKELLKEEMGIIFSPTKPWQEGKYLLQVESKLEDLAGNNLFRPFDRDLKKEPVITGKEFYERKFVMR